MSQKIHTVRMFREPLFDVVLEESGCKYVPPEDFNDDLMTWTFQTKKFNLAKINWDMSKSHAQNRVVLGDNPDIDSKAKVDTEACANLAAAIQKRPESNVLPALAVFQLEMDILVGDGFNRRYILDLLGVEEVEGIYRFSHPFPFEVAAKFNCVGSIMGETPKQRLSRCVTGWFRKLSRGDTMPSIDSWSTDFRLKASSVERQIRQEETRQFITEHGLRADRIASETLNRINSVRMVDEPGAVALAEIVQQYGLKIDEADDLVDGYKDRKKGPEAKAKYLADAKARLDGLLRGGHILPVTPGPKKPTVTRRSKERIVLDLILRLSTKFGNVEMARLKKMAADRASQSAIKANMASLKELLK